MNDVIPDRLIPQTIANYCLRNVIKLSLLMSMTFTYAPILELVQAVRHIASTSFLTTNFLPQVNSYLRKSEFLSTSVSNTHVKDRGLLKIGAC